MQHVAEGESIEVAPAETFVIERRGLDGSGYRTTVEVPDGVEHVGTRDPIPATSEAGRRSKRASAASAVEATKSGL